MDLSIRKKAAIRTKRLTLKPYAQEDVPALAKLLQNKEITKTFMVPDFETKAQVAVLVQKLISFSSLADTRHLRANPDAFERLRNEYHLRAEVR